MNIINNVREYHLKIFLLFLSLQRRAWVQYHGSTENQHYKDHPSTYDLPFSVVQKDKARSTHEMLSNFDWRSTRRRNNNQWSAGLIFEPIDMPPRIAIPI